MNNNSNIKINNNNENNSKIMNERNVPNPGEEENIISLKIRLEALESENKNIKQQLTEFHESFTEMERLKNNEINALNDYIKDLQNKNELLKNKNKIISEANSKLTLENSTLMKENNSLKFDRDILTKNIQELTEDEKIFENQKKK